MKIWGISMTIINTALLDANILYPAPIRDIFMHLGLEALLKIRWTDDIHREWIDALIRNEPHRERKKLERTRDKMDLHIYDAKIFDYQHLIPDLDLPDPDDRHVLAAAIVGQCNLIVTQNIKDFPPAVLDAYGIEAIHPDDCLGELLQTYQTPFCAVIKTIRANLKNPPYSVDDYLNALDRVGLAGTATRLREFADLL